MNRKPTADQRAYAMYYRLCRYISECKRTGADQTEKYANKLQAWMANAANLATRLGRQLDQDLANMEKLVGDVVRAIGTAVVGINNQQLPWERPSRFQRWQARRDQKMADRRREYLSPCSA